MWYKKIELWHKCWMSFWMWIEMCKFPLILLNESSLLKPIGQWHCGPLCGSTRSTVSCMSVRLFHSHRTDEGAAAVLLHLAVSDNLMGCLISMFDFLRDRCLTLGPLIFWLPLLTAPNSKQTHSCTHMHARTHTHIQTHKHNLSSPVKLVKLHLLNHKRATC